MPVPGVIPDTLVRRIANGKIPITAARQACEEARNGFAPDSAERGLKLLSGYLRESRESGRRGRYTGALVLGTVWYGDKFLDRIGSDRLLIIDSTAARFDSSLTQLRQRIRAVGDDDLEPLAERLDTYLALHHLRTKVTKEHEAATVALRARPFRHGKTILALANFAFMRRDFEFTGGDELLSLFGERPRPEDVAAAASAVLALANDVQPLESADFTVPLVGLELGQICAELLNYGYAVHILREVEKLISILRYRLTLVEGTRRTVFRLYPPAPEIEFALRLGFMRSELGSQSARLHVAKDGGFQGFSLRALGEDLIARTGEGIFEIADAGTPRRRMRMHVPVLRRLYESLSKTPVYEEFVQQEQLAQELELPMRSAGEGPWNLVEGLDLEMFARAWKSLAFTCLLDTLGLKRHQHDTPLLHNSLIRVLKRDHFADLLVAFGLTEEQVPAFLNLVSADVGRLGHLDLQYRPFLAINSTSVRLPGRMLTTPPEIVFAPTIVAMSNVVPNIQRAHGIRIATNAAAFVELAAGYIQSVVPKVRTNRQVKSGLRKTDVDIVALGVDALYLFECKHSLTPTEAHELRDLWQDIQKESASWNSRWRSLASGLAVIWPAGFPALIARSHRECK